MNPLPAYNPAIRYSRPPLARIPVPELPALRPVEARAGTHYVMPTMRRQPAIVPQNSRTIEIRRFAATLMDSLPGIFGGGIFCFITAHFQLGPLAWPHSFLERVVYFIQRFPQAAALGLGLCWLSHVLYSGIFLWRQQPTLGQSLCGIVLRPATGTRLEFRHFLWREIFIIVSVLSCGAGFLWALVDERGRTWHDVLAETELKNAT